MNTMLNAHPFRQLFTLSVLILCTVITGCCGMPGSLCCDPCVPFEPGCYAPEPICACPPPCLPPCVDSCCDDVCGDLCCPRFCPITGIFVGIPKLVIRGVGGLLTRATYCNCYDCVNCIDDCCVPNCAVPPTCVVPPSCVTPPSCAIEPACVVPATCCAPSCCVPACEAPVCAVPDDCAPDCCVPDVCVPDCAVPPGCAVPASCVVPHGCVPDRCAHVNYFAPSHLTSAVKRFGNILLGSHGSYRVRSHQVSHSYASKKAKTAGHSQIAGKFPAAGLEHKSDRQIERILSAGMTQQADGSWVPTQMQGNAEIKQVKHELPVFAPLVETAQLLISEDSASSARPATSTGKSSPLKKSFSHRQVASKATTDVPGSMPPAAPAAKFDE